MKKKPVTENNFMEQKAEDGNKYDGEKLRIDLTPWLAVLGMATTTTCGAMKYDADNWKKGMSFSRYFGGLLRHLISWWLRDEIDEETGLKHIDQAVFCIMALSHYSKVKSLQKYDNRPEGEIEALREIFKSLKDLLPSWNEMFKSD